MNGMLNAAGKYSENDSQLQWCEKQLCIVLQVETIKPA